MNNKFSTPWILPILLIFLIAINGHLYGQLSNGRTLENINAGWMYLENNTKNIDQIQNTMYWQQIDLPHTWNRWDAVDLVPGYRRDASWYQKELFIHDYGQANYLLYFEGVNISSEIYINGVFAGNHVGGYVGFEIDITNQVKRGEKNIISIRVDNGYNPNVIPSQKSDFFIFGGITRDVWLKVVPAFYLKNIAVTTPVVSAKRATTVLDIQFNDLRYLQEDVLVKSKITENKTGIVVSEIKINSSELKKGKPVSFPDVEKPKLWSPEHPNLYTLTTQLLKGDKIIDVQTNVIGYRWFYFDDNGAFFLNGEKLLLRGTHRHEDHAGYGAAMPNEQHRKDIALIKEMGANFIRLGHYPQDPEVYKACNELGLIVWDELPWCRGGVGEAEWQDNTERLLKEQIIQNYNHPCIFFWSLGNEIYWLPDFENGDEEIRLNNSVEKLNNIAHQLDKYRLTAIRKYYPGAELVDVFSPSIWSGWYAGVYANYKNTLTENQKKYPRFLHMEYGGSSHLGRHTENPVSGDGSLNEDGWAEVVNQVNIKSIANSGDWTENYIVDLFDWYLGVSEQQENFAGNAQWAFKDFGTPLRPENAIPYMNQKGLVDRAGNPKDAFYVFKSYWAKAPFTYIESHTWTERRGPKDITRNISVFSNCEKVELLHNGKKLGIKKRTIGAFPACGLNWDVLFVAGKNELIAHGYKNENIIYSDTLSVHYDYEKPGTPDHISLSYRLLASGNYLVEAFMMDEKGLRVLDYEKPVYFTSDGSGELLKNYGTPTRSQVIQMANGRAAIEVVPSREGKAIIEVRNQDFKGSYLIIDFSKKIQALLLTQPFDFDPSDKDKVTGKYVNQKKVIIPENLAAQSKWMMFEGPVLENDLIAYRYYADSRHRFDVYGKTVSDLVMDTVSWKYHDIMDWGSDILKVGNSLGIGSPAIWFQDSLYTLSECDQKTIEILDSSTNSATIRTEFKGLIIGENKIDLIQDWRMEPGKPWAEITLKLPNGDLPEGMYFATGIVKHLPQISTGEYSDYFYAMNWGGQSYHHENMGMAILAKKIFHPEPVADELNHAFVFLNAKQEVSYRFLAAWERDNNKVRDEDGFKKLVEKSGR